MYPYHGARVEVCGQLSGVNPSTGLSGIAQVTRLEQYTFTQVTSPLYIYAVILLTLKAPKTEVTTQLSLFYLLNMHGLKHQASCSHLQTFSQSSLPHGSHKN